MRIRKELARELSPLCAWGFQQWAPLFACAKSVNNILASVLGIPISGNTCVGIYLHGYVFTLRLRGSVLVIGIENSKAKGCAHVILRCSFHVWFW